MKRNAQGLTMSSSSSFSAAGARTREPQGTDRGAVAFLAVLAALALVMGTMVPAAFADEATTTTGTAADTTTDTTATSTDGIFASGTGTAEDPFTIDNATQLGAFRDSVNAGTTYEGQYVQLSGDIDLPSTDWTPIGSGARSGDGASADAKPFKGTFNGGDHTISGLTITASSPLAANPDNALGLFGVLDGAHVNALTLTNVNIDVPTSNLAGAAAGLALNDASLSNIHVSGKVSGASNIGGIVGCMIGSGAIVTSGNEATVSGTGDNIGGIVGTTLATDDDQIRLSFNINDGAVSGASAVGGIVGHNEAHLSFNANNGTVTTASSSTGNAVGEEGEHSIIENENDTEAVDPNTGTTVDGTPITGPAVGSPIDGTATQQAGTADPNATADNTAQTGASLQQTGDDLGRVLGVIGVLAVAAGLTTFLVRRRSH